MFPPGSYIPIIDYTMPKEVDDQTQYDTNKVFAAYDGLADFPDRPTNLVAVANATFGAAIGHTPSAFTTPDDVPRRTSGRVVNSKGATTTTYMIPVDHLPADGGAALPRLCPTASWTRSTACCSRWSMRGTRTTTTLRPGRSGVDPVNGMDPLALVDGGTRGGIEDAFATVRSFLPPLP